MSRILIMFLNDDTKKEMQPSILVDDYELIASGSGGMKLTAWTNPKLPSDMFVPLRPWDRSADVPLVATNQQLAEPTIRLKKDGTPAGKPGRRPKQVSAPSTPANGATEHQAA